MTRCELCGHKASVSIAGKVVCWSDYNHLLKVTKAKGRVLKPR